MSRPRCRMSAASLFPRRRRRAVTAAATPPHFNGFVPGRIALIQRGTCSFFDKVKNAERPGATAVIIFNEGQPGRRTPSGNAWRASGYSGARRIVCAGQTLFNLGNPTCACHTDTTSEPRETYNVLAEFEVWRADRTVVVGAHLDLVTEGPGINDNGSGTAAVLETALQMAKFRQISATRCGSCSSGPRKPACSARKTTSAA